MSNPQIFSVTNKQEGEYISTLGPKGVAAISAIVGAKSCLPYAHSWAELGSYTTQDEMLIKETQEELKKIGASTKVIPWHIGEGYFYQDNETICHQVFN